MSKAGASKSLTHAVDIQNETAEELSGAEHFLVGVSPQYWSHTPMCIKYLHELGLVDGIDCLVVKNQARFIPVSKCELQGAIVNAERRSNGSCLYLLDDGTGVVDCLSWADNSMYSLPSLIPHDDDHGTFRVGDIVRVFGKIKCVSIGPVRESIKAHGREWNVQEGVREVHITGISSVPLNSQANHWLRCMHFAQRALIDATRAESTLRTVESGASNHLNYLEHKRTMTDPVRNGPDVLCLLGPEIASKAVQRTNFPAPDDAYGAWRVFGAGCRCDLPYLDSLLYCHCQATVVSLDHHFKFRDALLELLLRIEGDVNHSKNGNSIENSQLRFQYKTIVSNAALQGVAAETVENAGNIAVSVDRLFLQTFAALRKDGIVSLLDSNTDTYLLVSRGRVLEPHCKKLLQKTNTSLLERRVLQNEQPAYLRNVTSARLQYVKKTLTDNR